MPQVSLKRLMRIIKKSEFSPTGNLYLGENDRFVFGYHAAV